MRRQCWYSMGLVLSGVLGVGCASGVGLPDARLPVSTSASPVPEGAPHVVVSMKAIDVGDSHVVSLDHQQVPDKALRGLLITPLHAALLSADGDDKVLVELDRDLPAPLLTQVLYTAAQADFSTPWLIVRGPAGRSGIAITLPSDRTAAATASAPAKTSSGVGVGYANPTVRIDPAKGFEVVVRDEVYGEKFELPCAQKGCDTWPTDELNRLARRIKLDHARDRAVLLQPSDTANVQALVGAMDATRDDAMTSRGAREIFPTLVLGGAQ